MGGDYTRFTFDPVKGFSGVLRQQGRVSLDSAANELEAILDRRDRAEMYDTVGQAVYPLTTPDAFKIAVDAAGKLTIGQGRMYLDGILAECFGDMTNPANTNFDERMNDLVGRDPLAYNAQPFFYSAPSAAGPWPAFPVLSATAGVINLVYLDVWQREVTVFEDETLREIALNGPDTDTRVQTAWQVKVMGTPADAGSCLKPPAAWDALSAPSTARLTAEAIPTAPAPSPCVISAAGGYTGLENRLYRVEIHTAGTVSGANKAKFKWSRDNASLAASVKSTTAISAAKSIITVSSTGRDSWMRFEKGQHIELYDDDVEFAMRASGTGGILAKVTEVNHATGEIEVDQDLTALPIVPERHPRIRRWDIAAEGDAPVRETENGVAIALENGIQISFGPAAADTLHAGDHWVFAARTADGSIDTLEAAPPRNTLHHFTQLALVTSGAPPVVISDCRTPWPPEMSSQEGCCTVIVRPGQSIQAAIDSLPEKGGCVCLKVGDHPIVTPIRIRKSQVMLHGESIGARVFSTTSRELLIIGDPEKGIRDVDVHDIRFETAGRTTNEFAPLGGALVTVWHSRNVSVHDCSLAVLELTVLTGVVMIDSQHVRIVGNQVDGVTVGVHTTDDCSHIDVLDNRFQSFPREGRDFGLLGAAMKSLIGPCHVTGNRFQGFVEGIHLQSSTTDGDGSFVIDNRIIRGRPQDVEHAPLWGIAVYSIGCTIRDNSIDLSVVEHGGVYAYGASSRIEGNDIRSTVKLGQNAPVGIRLEGGKSNEDGIIRGNVLFGFMDAVHVWNCRGAEVLENDIRAEKAEAGGLQIGVRSGVQITSSSGTLISSNRISLADSGITTIGGRDERIVNNALDWGGYGILAESRGALLVADNVIQDMHGVGIGVTSMKGTTTISRCRLARCARADEKFNASIVVLNAAIEDLKARAEVVVEFNDVMDTGLRDGKLWRAVDGIRVMTARSRIQGNHVTYSDPQGLERKLECHALLLEAEGVESAEDNPLGNISWGLLLGNSFVGVGSKALVKISSNKYFDRLTFTDNYCEHWSGARNDDRATVTLLAQHALVQGNHVKAEAGYWSFDFNHSKRLVFIGNMCTGELLQFPPNSATSTAPGSKPPQPDRFNFF